ncbi:uncharacterized protein BXZ73DRAFT_73316 [Epithele typhae]|uniref:uncharacterized protein n=1 Tax=Epithele typhae TaxID=378194 RepID=UPI0020087B34|nr:uncharacterized protein BXZ73DRAFT_73316 [Epithele typhae]KAH9945112.1 hypothetical protein BXZ73DRAFT_73316 [Epithele typhae]
MSHVAASSSAGDGSSGGSSKRAPRGAACLNCRRRKMRCDGTRPICLQCVRTGRENDCEYTDGPDLSPTQQLEEQIVRLETRIRELEHPELVPPSVVLNPTQGPGSMPSPPIRPLLDISRVGSPAPLPAMFGMNLPALSQDPSVELPADLVRTLINTFMPCAGSLNFFINIPRFMHALQLPYGDPRRALLSPALLNAIYLWGAHLSSTPNVRAYEAVLLERAKAALATSVREPSAAVVYLIQAEVLVATYFFTMSRFLEGRYHSSAAVALTLSCRLTKIRSSTDQHGAPMGLTSHRRAPSIPPPRDAIEEGERIQAFWFVYALDKAWAVALGSPPHFNHNGSHVDTPWPLEMAQYEAGGMPPGFRSSLTINNFLVGGATAPTSVMESKLSLRAKAATLFERATHLSAQWTSPTVDRNEFFARYVALDALIDRFTSSLPPIDRSTPDAALTCLVTHTLAYAATIQIRSSFKPLDRMNDHKDLAAAEAAATVLENLNLPPTNIDPILAILWTAVCRTLIGEILRGRTQAHSSSQSFALPGPSTSTALSGFSESSARVNPTPANAPDAGPTGPPAARAVLDRILAVMNRSREACPLMGMIHDGFAILQDAM